MDLPRWFVVADVVHNEKTTRPGTRDTLWLARRYVTYVQTNYSALRNIQNKNIGIGDAEVVVFHCTPRIQTPHWTLLITKRRWRFAREKRQLFFSSGKFWRSTRVGSLLVRRSINQALCSSPHHRCFHRNPREGIKNPCLIQSGTLTSFDGGKSRKLPMTTHTTASVPSSKNYSIRRVPMTRGPILSPPTAGNPESLTEIMRASTTRA